MKKKLHHIKWNLTEMPVVLGWNRVRSVRKRLKLTVIDLASMAKISPATVTLIEKLGIDPQTKDARERISDTFGCFPEDIFPSAMIGQITEEEYKKKGGKPKKTLVEMQFFTEK